MNMDIRLGPHTDDFEKVSDAMRANDVLARIWDRDHTVWSPDPDEIADRLGWLDVHERMRAEVPALHAFRRELVDAGFTHALLLGMGGSSLAPEVFRKTFGVAADSLDLEILDSTDPGAIRSKTAGLDPFRTLYIVATKSGGTVETFSMFKHCYNLSVERVGAAAAGSRFIAITDPGSGLVDTAEKYKFRRVFLNDPEIGGRYSALSLFGLVPAALLGVDLDRLLDRAAAVAAASRGPDCDAARLGIALGVLALAGRDKLTLVLPEPIASFGDWVEQLVAESTGKRGRGILPVAGERPGGRYGADRVFAGLLLPGDDAVAARLSALEAAGHPVIRFELDDRYDLGGQFFLWELATAVTGHVMGIQPFDQPNVESAKVLARRMVDRYQETGALPDGEHAAFSTEAVTRFTAGMAAGGYIAIHAYLTPDEATDRAIADFREALREHTGAAVTAGYGPRFLHSTGQLHKGDAGNGRFIQFTADAEPDLPIPDEAGSPASAMTFGTLKLSQALGDFEALRQADPPRRVIRFHLTGDPPTQIAALSVNL
ncbi:MAG TPA: hypothetical protein VMN57_08965 [Anaerolineales bacterium]|nr:hypothetical protein [Anaerolineales bacterium]